MAKINEKAYIIIIIILVIISGVLLFRSCNAYDNGTGFKRIIDIVRWIGTGIRSAGNHISRADADRRRAIELNTELQNRIDQLENAITIYTTEFERLIGEHGERTATGSEIIERAREKTDRIRTIIEGTRTTGPE